MELSAAERAILINQFDMLAILDPDEAERYRQNAEILRSGYAVFYDDVVPWMGDEMRIEDSRFVFDVLDMFRVLEAFYRENPDSELLGHHSAHFRGFDGNEEPKYFGFAQFLIRDQGRYAEQLKNTDFAYNSHIPTIGRYGRMVEAWERLDRPYELTEDQTAAILDV